MLYLVLFSCLLLGASAYQCRDAEVRQGATLFVRDLCAEIERLGGYMCADDFVRCMNTTYRFQVMNALQLCSVSMAMPEIADLSHAYRYGCQHTNEGSAIEFGCCLIEMELQGTDRSVSENLSASRSCVGTMMAVGHCT